MKKTYILDTSIIINDPNCLNSLKGNQIVIPIDVLNELDKLKTFQDQVAKNARLFIRKLDELIKLNQSNNLKIDEDTSLEIDTEKYNNKFEDEDIIDNKIISCAFYQNLKKENVILLSNDINLRVRATAFKIKSEGYKKKSNNATDLYKGHRVIQDDELGKILCEEKYLTISDYEDLESLNPNEFVNFETSSGNGICIGRRIEDALCMRKPSVLWGLKSKNREQAYATDLLMDPSIPLVTLTGKAGTGKTVLTVAAGLDSVINKKAYNQLIVYKPMEPVGREVGYLPGNLEEKLDPWAEALKDSLNFLTSSGNGSGRKSSWKDKLSQYTDQITFEALTYIRGRSITNAYIIIDECQNTTKEQIKTVLTRVGMNSKIVLLGDIDQIDHSYLDAVNNGLTYTIEAFKDSNLSGHVTLERGERSDLATEAALRL
jgi:PhoH-like ATPase